MAVAVLAALLVTSGKDEVGSTAESSARAACELLDQVADDVDTEDEKSNTVFQHRLASVFSLALLAEQQDGSFAGLSEAVARMRRVFVNEFSIDVPEFREAREDAEDECAGLG